MLNEQTNRGNCKSNPYIREYLLIYIPVSPYMQFFVHIVRSSVRYSLSTPV